jgi:Cys-tRNA(Pro)/Cys-tRNA(Cys) deacylase
MSRQAKSQQRTNAVRILERLGVRFEIRTYEVDPEDLRAETVARKVGLPDAQVLKTLLARGPGGCVFAVVPAGMDLDRKALAKALGGDARSRRSSAGDKSVDLVPLKEVEPLTGYVRGGVTVFGAKKAFPVVVDDSALQWDVVSVSAGARGAQLLLSPTDYVKAAGARVAPIARRRD